MARKNDSNEQRDEGVLRAKDIIPPYGGEVTKAQRPQKAEEVPPAKDMPAAGKPGQDQSDIPKFDLAEKVLAEQRKVSARRRKGPTASAREAPMRIEPVSPKPRLEPAGHAIEQPSPMLLEQDQIIAEIVARDIARLCRPRG